MRLVAGSAVEMTDLDTTDTEAPEHYDLDGYEDEGAGPRVGGDYSPTHGTPASLFICPCPNPCLCSHPPR